MLTELHLGSFKCFETLDLPLRPLTVLSGANGGGKSSVIQALVLLAQTFAEREWGRVLPLNGRDVALGTAADALNQTSARRRLSIGAATARMRVAWTFRADDRRALALELDRLAVDGQEVELGQTVRWLLPSAESEKCDVVESLRRVSWISAERNGPREFLPLLDAHDHVRVGARGELAAGLLYWRGEERVPEALCIPDEISTLFHQVRAWMRHFFPGADLRLSRIDGANAIALQMKSDPRTEFQRPQNVGFGLTQLFPVLVASLAAQPGDILLVENPEVHLHPRAQQDAGSLLARVAAGGVQVFVETHSDHVLNGIRLAVKRRQLAADRVALHFFGRTGGSGTPLLSPTIDEDGRIDTWPEGFFDQFDAALAELL